MLDYVATVNDVVRRHAGDRRHVANAQVDVVQPETMRFLAGEIKLCCVEIQPDYASAGANSPGQLKGDIASAAAEIEASHPSTDCHPVE